LQLVISLLWLFCFDVCLTFRCSLGDQPILHPLWNSEHCLCHLAHRHVFHHNSAHLFSTCCGRSQVVVAGRFAPPNLPPSLHPLFANGATFFYSHTWQCPAVAPLACSSWPNVSTFGAKAKCPAHCRLHFSSVTWASSATEQC